MHLKLGLWIITTSFRSRFQRMKMVQWNNPGEVYKHFQILSNYLLGTDNICCPSEHFPRWPADSFLTVNNTNVSYFININAGAREHETTILSGDRNIKGGINATQGGMLFKSDSSAFWDNNLHSRNGNILLTDGSVTNINNSALRRTLHGFVTNEMHLLIP
jgi:prepilin-type processing-associated H-X9-DG protein